MILNPSFGNSHSHPLPRVVITGIGLTSPLGNNLAQYRGNLLEGKSGIKLSEIRHMGPLPAGTCEFDEFLYQSKKFRRRGTRAGSIGIFCAQEALKDAGLKMEELAPDRVGVYIGVTEHGNVTTEEEIHQLYQNKLDTALWSPNHNHRTVANNPAGEVTLNLGITGPHYTLGGACAAGNLGPIQGLQMLQLGMVDVALAGGVSESPATFGIFAAFKSQGALGSSPDGDPTKASRPLDADRNGIVVSEGGCLYVLETLDRALRRGAKIYGEIVGYHVNSDAKDYVLPNAERQTECFQKALNMSQLRPHDVDIVSLHATGTPAGDIVECNAMSQLFHHPDQEFSPHTHFNGTKGHIGHSMGASGALELAGNLPSFTDGQKHAFRPIANLDPQCAIKGLLTGEVLKNPLRPIKVVANNSFGMLGINSVLIVKHYENQ
jgi:3-oxoacyl-[acyl-carrier-protein] synthase II